MRAPLRSLETSRRRGRAGRRPLRLAIALGLIATGTRIRVAGAADPTLVWSIAIDEANDKNDSAEAIAVDGAGDVIAAGQLGKRFAVVKRNGTTGAAVWQRRLNGTLSSATTGAHAVALDHLGNVYAAGYLVNAAAGGDFTVVKLNAGDGSTLWTASIKGGDANALTLDKSGDVVAVGSLDHQTSPRFAVTRLSRSDGHVLWEEQLGGDKMGVGEAVAIDGHGNPIVVGYVGTPLNPTNYTVFKLAIGTGHVTWHQGFTGFDGLSNAVAITAGDAVVTGGTRDGHFTVIKLKGSSGQKLWEYVRGNQLSPPLQAWKVALTSGDDVVASGYTAPQSNPEHSTTPEVVLLRGSSGAELWSHVAGASGNGPIAGAYAVVGPLDAVLAVGQEKDKIRVDKRAFSDGSDQGTWSASKPSSARAIRFRDDALFIAGTQAGTGTGTGTDMLLVKLAIPPPCKKGKAGCGDCTPPCGPHQVCESGHCRIIEPAQPGGHMHKQ